MSPQPYDPIGAIAISNMKFTFSHKIGSVSYFISSNPAHQEPSVSKVESSGRDPPSLLILPPEIRSMIYRYVFDDFKVYARRTTVYEKKTHRHRLLSLKTRILPTDLFALLRTSKEIYNEAVVIASSSPFAYFSHGNRYACPIKNDVLSSQSLARLCSFTGDVYHNSLSNLLGVYNAGVCPSLQLIDLSFFTKASYVVVDLPAAYINAYLDNELYKSKYVDAVFQRMIGRALRLTLEHAVLEDLNARNITLKFKMSLVYMEHRSTGLALRRDPLGDVLATLDKNLVTILTLTDLRKGKKREEYALPGNKPRLWHERTPGDEEIDSILPAPEVDDTMVVLR
ncbi:hypothetical protein LTR10_024107 [Elasticomyces elasticus]|uniref:F-box domain-containing protein n=1 Tax=Exophiala sideris TaxID=1016849 RepID=A0ABR0JP85_9EURO|nr:hypothetical protein LTR10_024107 [Elasticomyces elasticus]KAK5038312.1 hypothetical protein LTS07_001782 [Exophiala sideris]KAK5044296.1 hypothetical protein LTR13_000652 [Exophiala sideris]KAK5067796.1 hypothetical protein LTR69_001785 [Exophiala sideris]KAK5183964.1 hypothetical protein LTR44_003469 [Eurotiomycetes sp. CCFEE 6388]